MRRPGRVLLAAVLGAAACSGATSTGSGPAPGADGDRGGQPAMVAVTLDDVAADVGLTFRHGAFRWGAGGDPAAMMGGGLCWLDYDRNGWLDLFVTNTWSDGEYDRWASEEDGPPTSRLFVNEAGAFRDVSDEVGAALAVRGAGCVAADLDGDDWTDLFVTTDRANLLLWNEDGERFTEGAAEAGLATYGWHAGAAVGDVDGDGRLDLFVAGYADVNRPIPEATRGFPNTVEPEPDLLLLNEGAADGDRPTFRDVAADVGIEADGLDYGLGAVLSDVDQDGDLDLFVANDTDPNRLYLNDPGDGEPGFRLTEQGTAAGVDDDNAGMGVAAGDYDGDGAADLIVTNMGDQLHAVHRHGGVGPAGPAYGDALRTMGLDRLGSGLTGWGVAWVDIDLDTDLDLVIAHGGIPVRSVTADAEPLQVFENRTVDGEPGRFADASRTLGLAEVGHLLARGLAAADYDNDGDLDLAVATIGGELALLRSTGADGHWLTVAPDPATPGTVVTVTTSTGTTVRRELLAGSSYLSSEDPRLHVGLGPADEIELVQVRWPDGTVVERSDVPVDTIADVAR